MLLSNCAFERTGSRPRAFGTVGRPLNASLRLHQSHV